MPVLGITASSKSTPGLQLTPRTLPVTFYLNGFAKGGTSSKWLVGSFSSTAAATSTDGITWTTVTASMALIYTLAGNPGTSYVTGGGSTINRSPDGTSWAAATPVYSGSSYWLKYFPVISAYIKSNTGSAMEYGSTNGATWTATSSGFTSYDASTNGTIVGFPSYNQQYFQYTNAASFPSIFTTSVNLGSTKNWIGTAYDSTNNKFVCYDDTTVLAYSTSGTSSWTTISRPAFTGTQEMSNDGGGGAYFLGGIGSYLYSTNATTWTKVDMAAYGSSNYYYGRWDSANSRFLIMKNNSTQYFTGVKP
jgi:hypothetical protein